MTIESVAPASVAPTELLSAREIAVVTALARGARIKQIARELDLSVKTVSTYHARAKKKLGARSLHSIIFYCIRHGLIEVPKVIS